MSTENQKYWNKEAKNELTDFVIAEGQEDYITKRLWKNLIRNALIHCNRHFRDHYLNSSAKMNEFIFLHYGNLQSLCVKSFESHVALFLLSGTGHAAF